MTQVRRVARIVLAGAACSFMAAASSAGPATERLAQLIAERQVSSVERALDLLPYSLRAHFALVFRSRSLQQASLANPRVILFGDDARFVVTFNGQADQRGFDSLEVMEYDDQESRFEFREIKFPGGATPTGRVLVSEPDPAKCGACHGHPARPIWDTHPSWPGAFGEQYHAPLGQAEQDGLDLFLSAQPTHPRFQALKNVRIFADPNTFAPTAKFLYSGTETEPPNAALSRLFGALNARSIAHELASAPTFATYRYALLGALSKDCGSIGDYFSEAFFAELAPGLASFAERSRRVTAQQLDLKRLRLLTGAHGLPFRPSSDVEQLVPFRYLVEALLGVSTAQWTLALEKDTYDFSSPQSPSDELDRQLLAIVAGSDASILDLAALRDLGAGQKYCRYLQARSSAATKELRAGDALGAARLRVAAHAARHETPPAPGRPAALRSCIACHQGDVARSLPFASPQALGESLSGRGYPHGTLLNEIVFRLSPQAGQERMPRGANLPDEDRTALEDYFRALASAARR